MLLSLKDLLDTNPNALLGKRVLIRSDLNVPMDKGVITEDTRIRASLPAMTKCLDAGATVMITSHFGRPKEGIWSEEVSLGPVAIRIQELLQRPVPLIRNWVDQPFLLEPGSIVLLENCRIHIGETKNDPELSKKMAALCDIYVNDAFATAHRAESTTEGIVHKVDIACAGPLLTAEWSALQKVLDQPKSPVVAIVSGSKVSTKLSILRSLSTKVDHLIVGGGIANTFLLAKRYGVGKSLVEVELVEEAKRIMELMKDRIHLPIDVVVANEYASSAVATIKRIEEVNETDMILDVGPLTLISYEPIFLNANTIVWNGPLGVFEWETFSQGTKQLTEMISSSNAFTLAGGGDTLAVIAKYGIQDQIDYISTGGGAFLECLEGKILPAIKALQTHFTKKAE